jgi:hypothetical protein
MDAEVDSDLESADESNVVLPDKEQPYDNLSMDMDIAYSDEELTFAADPPLLSAPDFPNLAENSHPATGSQSRCAQVEDVEDDEPGPASHDRWYETFPTPAGTPKGRGRPRFEMH